MQARMIAAGFTAAAGIALAAGAMAGGAYASTGPHTVRNAHQVADGPDGVSPTTLITPNLAGYYRIGIPGDSHNLGSTWQLSADSADATSAQGQEECSNATGWLAGIAAFNNNNGTWTVEYGDGQQTTTVDGDPCLVGPSALPATDRIPINALNLSAVPTTDQLTFYQSEVHGTYRVGKWVGKKGHAHFRYYYYTKTGFRFYAENDTAATNVWTATVWFPKGVNPVFNEPGTGVQQPAACTTPIPAGTVVAGASDVTADGAGLAAQTAVQVDALPSSASLGELSPESTLSPTSGTAPSSYVVETVGALC
jgi:hypothetical protein